jgi:hypothetical protein
LQINYNNTTDAVALKEEEEEQNQLLNPYTMFKYSIRSELTRKYYERRLRKFLDFIQFEIAIIEIEKRCNDFAEKGKSNIDWTVNQIIRFLHFQKERVENEGITAATLKNFIIAAASGVTDVTIRNRFKDLTRNIELN